MAWRNPSCGGRNFEDKLRSTSFLTRKEFSRVLSGHVAVSSACGSKFVSRSSRKATVAESVFVG